MWWSSYGAAHAPRYRRPHYSGRYISSLRVVSKNSKTHTHDRSSRTSSVVHPVLLPPPWVAIGGKAWQGLTLFQVRMGDQLETYYVYCKCFSREHSTCIVTLSPGETHHGGPLTSAFMLRSVPASMTPFSWELMATCIPMWSRRSDLVRMCGSWDHTAACLQPVDVAHT